MIVDTATLAKDEQTYLDLQHMFEAAGYSLYKMRKFEEYSLYLDNKNFLGTDAVLTFNGSGGRLMALKPDVTLSIVKNAKPVPGGKRKLYYRESVYRKERGAAEFREINQMGLECIGEISPADAVDICALAVESLSAIDPDFVFCVSHMSFMSGLLTSCGAISAEARSFAAECIRAKNPHDLLSSAAALGIPSEGAGVLAEFASGATEFAAALAAARARAVTEETTNAVAELEELCSRFAGTENASKIRLDFSILNDVDYYNGLIFQGYVKRISKPILSGGRYDGLLQKFGKDAGAMGFALSLSELAAGYPRAAGAKI